MAAISMDMAGTLLCIFMKAQSDSPAYLDTGA